MKISQINNTNFKAGTVSLRRIDKEKFINIDAINKIAKEKDLDILITKNRATVFLPREDMYTILALKEIPVVARGFFQMGSVTKHGASCVITDKNTARDELSVKMFNAVMNAVENLEKKISNIK